MYILNLVEYVLWVPDSFARPPGRPAGLLASDSGTSSRIEPNHTKALAVLFTAAWQHPHQCLGALPGRRRWQLAGVFSCCGAGQLHLTRRRHDQLSAHQQHQPQPATQSTLLTGLRKTWASSWGVNDELH